MGIWSGFIFDYRSKLSQEELFNNILKADFCVGDFRYRVKSYDKEKGTLFLPCRRTNALAPRNSFMPEIKVRVTEDEQGTKAEVTLRLNTVVLVFAMVYAALCAIFQIILFVMCIVYRAWPTLPMFIPSFLFVFMVLMTAVGGYFSAKRVKASIMCGVFGK